MTNTDLYRMQCKYEKLEREHNVALQQIDHLNSELDRAESQHEQDHLAWMNKDADADRWAAQANVNFDRARVAEMKIIELRYYLELADEGSPLPMTNSEQAYEHRITELLGEIRFKDSHMRDLNDQLEYALRRLKRCLRELGRSTTVVNAELEPFEE